MHRGRFGSSVIAIGSLFFFVNLQAAYADDAGWLASHPVTDGSSCANVDTSGHGGHGCGFLGLGCVGDANAHAWDDTGGKVVSAVASAPWGQIGRDAASFAVNFAIAAVTAAVVTAVVVAAVVAFPVAAPFIIGAAIIAGAAGLAYMGYQLSQNAGHMTQADWFGFAGSITGSLAGGLGPIGAASRAAGAAVGGLSPFAVAAGTATSTATDPAVVAALDKVGLAGRDSTITDTGAPAPPGGTAPTVVLPKNLPPPEAVLKAEPPGTNDPLSPDLVCQ